MWASSTPAAGCRAEGRAEGVVGHLADEPTRPPRAATPTGVGRRAARHLHAGSHPLVDGARAGQVDQFHDALDQTQPAEVVVVAWARTSTRALPTATTSSGPRPRRRGRRPELSLHHRHPRPSRARPVAAPMPPPPATRTDPSAAYRLPYTVEPRRYEIRLVPDLAAATFAGQVRIEAVAHEAVTSIALHGAELRRRPTPSSSGGTTLPAPPPWTRSPNASRSPSPRPSGRARPPSSCSLHRDPERQAPRLLPLHLHRRRRRRPTSSPPPSSKPPTPGGPSPASTSPTARPSSPSPSTSPPASTRSRTARPSTSRRWPTAAGGSASPTPW